MSTKIICWTAVYQLNDVKVLISVRADSRTQARDKFVAAGFDIVDETHIRQTCMIKPPLPKIIQKMDEFDWEDEAKEL